MWYDKLKVESRKYFSLNSKVDFHWVLNSPIFVWIKSSVSFDENASTLYLDKFNTVGNLMAIRLSLLQTFTYAGNCPLRD